MSDEIKRTANWEPGTLDKTRRNIGNIEADEAADMAKKLGGEVMYERSERTSSENLKSQHNTGRIIRNSNGNSSNSSGNSTSNESSVNSRRRKENLPQISKKTETLIDKLMISSEYKIKPNYGLFNFIRTLQKNGTEKILPAFSEYTLKQQVEHIEAFITVIKTLIQIAPATYKSKIANGTETKFKFLRMVASWKAQGIKAELAIIQSLPQPVLTEDLIPYTRAVFKMLITVYYYGTNKIPKLIKEIYNDESSYADAPKDQLSSFAKKAITEWLYIDTEIIKRLYPLLMRMCSDSYELYPEFFRIKISEILKFCSLHKFDLLLPEKPKEEAPKEKPKPAVPQKGIKDSSVVMGLKLLDQLFPQAGFSKLDEFPDFYPYFQPLYNFNEGFNLLSPENPLQTILVIHRIIEDCFQGCNNIKFLNAEASNKDEDCFAKVKDDWPLYREDSFQRLYAEPLVAYTNAVYSQSGYEKTHIGKKTLSELLWDMTYQFLPNFKFDQLILEHPANQNKHKALFHRTDLARKYLATVVSECDAAVKTKGNVKSIENPWEHYKFPIQNEISKRIDVLLGAQNYSPTTNANNANLLKYTLCFVSVLDWYINNPDSPAYKADPMHLYRVSHDDGKPEFSVKTRNDQNKLFAEAIKASYAQKAK